LIYNFRKIHSLCYSYKFKLNVLITGATGNVGLEIISILKELQQPINLASGVRDITKAKRNFPILEDIKCVEFDFEKESTFDSALDNIDIIFLLRPPHIVDIKTYFEPLICKIFDKGIKKIVFFVSSRSRENNSNTTQKN